MSQTKAQLIDPVDGTIVNADINASAAIAASKIADFVTGNVNNRVLTASGTANSLVGESGLLFTSDSNDHILTLTGSGQAHLQLTSTSGTDHCSIDFGDSDDNDIGEIRYTNSTNSMHFDTNATLQMTLDSDGRLFIGTTTTTLGSGGVFGELNIRGGTEGAGIHLADNNANVHGGIFTSDNSLAMFIRTITNHPLIFRTNNSERFRIDNTGKVGLGLQNSSNICDPDGNGLLIRAASTVGTTKGHIMLTGDSATVDEGPQIVFSESGSGSNFAGAYVGHRRSGGNSTGSLVFGVRTTSGDLSTVPTEVMRINSDLKVAIGSTSASSPLQVFGIDTTIGTQTYPQLTLQTASTDGAADKGSGIMFLNHDGAAGKFGGNIRVLNENATSGNHASYMAFATRPAGGSVSEAMRINSSSNLLIATTTTVSNGATARLQIVPSNGNSAIACKHVGTNDGNIIEIQHQRAGTNSGTFVGTAMSFRQQDGNQVGTIQIANTATNYNTSSDYRLKENEVAISDGITRLKTLKPYKFNFKGDSKIVDGFFAHEVTAVPEAISGTKDEVDENGNPKYQGIDQSKLVPLLVAAVKELITKVETLEAA